MSAGAVAFMLLTWGGVVALAAFCVRRTLRGARPGHSTLKRTKNGSSRSDESSHSS